MRQPDLRQLCRWLGVAPEAVAVLPGLTSSVPVGARLRSLVRDGAADRHAIWASVGRALVRQEELPAHLETLLADDWRYRLLLALPPSILQVLVPRVVFPSRLAGELGPVMFEGKTRIKVFRTDDTILNVVKEGAEDLFLADIAARQHDPSHLALTPGLLEAGQRQGVHYFVEPCVPGTPIAREQRDSSTLSILVALLGPWYEERCISSLGGLSDYIGGIAAGARAILRAIAPEVRESAGLDEVQEILARCERLAHDFSPIGLRGATVHGDLNPGNILKSVDRWVLLDWECSRRASLTHDVFNFASWLAVFDNDYQVVRAALRGEGPISELLLGSEGGEGSSVASEMSRAYALSYTAEKLVLQLETGRHDGRVLRRRLGRWTPYWTWLLGAIDAPRHTPVGGGKGARL